MRQSNMPHKVVKQKTMPSNVVNGDSPHSATIRVCDTKPPDRPTHKTGNTSAVS